MAGYDQTIKVKATYHLAAKDFFAFLQAVGRKYARPVRVNYRYLKRGRFYVTIDGSPGGIDALFQELILNRGLYYYICSIRNNKNDLLPQKWSMYNVRMWTKERGGFGWSGEYIRQRQSSRPKESLKFDKLFIYAIYTTLERFS